MTDLERLEDAQKRQVTDAFITDYEKTNSDGEKVIEHPDGKNNTKEINLSKLFRAGLSTTTDISLLVAEAELAAEGRCGANPHLPATNEVRKRAERRLEAADLDPAWLIFDDGTD